MLDRYALTKSAQTIIERSRQEAQTRNHPEVKPFHILLAMTVTPEGTASLILRRLGINSTAIIRDIEAREPKGKKPFKATPLLSEKSQKVMDKAYRLAKAADQSSIGSEHILLALFQVPSMASQLLDAQDTEYEAVERELRLLTRSSRAKVH